MTANRALAVAAAMMVVYCIFQVAGVKLNESGRDLFVCNFENMKGDYVASRRELSREGNTIFVSQGPREFMFSRRFLGVCIDQQGIQFDE